MITAWLEGNKHAAQGRCKGSPGCLNSDNLYLRMNHRFLIGSRSGQIAGQSVIICPIRACIGILDMVAAVKSN